MKDNNLNMIVYNLALEGDKNKLDQFIADYIPFIIKTISDEKKEYVVIENDEEYSIALLAFSEAINRFQYDKGQFISFAKLVIISRLRNYWKSENKHSHDYIEDMEKGGMLIEDDKYDNLDLRLEIDSFEQELLKFGINFELLIDETPKHKDTKENAVNISRKVSKEEDLITFLYAKKRLPITKISKRFEVTLKVLKRSRIFITSVIIIFFRDFKLIQNWID